MDEYENEKELIDYLNVIWKRKWLIIIPTFICVVAVGEVLAQAVENRLERAREAEVEMTIRDEAPGSLIQADPDGLHVIFDNLLGNGIKYSTGTEKKVDVELNLRGDRVCVSIRDNGIGIPPEEQAMVFNEFCRAANVAATSVGGSGLGLAVAQELVSRYRGEIALESIAGVGTTVTVEFPLISKGAA